MFHFHGRKHGTPFAQAASSLPAVHQVSWNPGMQQGHRECVHIIQSWAHTGLCGSMFCVILMTHSPASFPPPPKALRRRHSYIIKFLFLQHLPHTNTEMQALLFFPSGRHWTASVLTLFSLNPQIDFWLTTAGETATDHFCSLHLWGWFLAFEIIFISS